MTLNEYNDLTNLIEEYGEACQNFGDFICDKNADECDEANAKIREFLRKFINYNSDEQTSEKKDTIIIYAKKAREIACCHDNERFQIWTEKIMNKIKATAENGDTHLYWRIPFIGNNEKSDCKVSPEMAERIRTSLLDYGYRISDCGKDGGGLYFTIYW